MPFRKIASSNRLSSNSNGTGRTYSLDPMGGGSNVKVAQYAVVVLDKSATAKLKLELMHGPGTQYWTSHSVPLADEVVGSTPVVRIGDADPDLMICEYRLVSITVTDSVPATEQWVTVDDYEMTKPF